MTGTQRTVQRTRFAFLNRHISDVPEKRFELAAKEVLALNPNTGTLPMFRSRKDADITLGIYSRHPVLIRDDDPDGNPWGLSFATLFHMANDSGLFHTRRRPCRREVQRLVLQARRQGVRAALRGEDAQPLRPSVLDIPRRDPGAVERGHSAEADR